MPDCEKLGIPKHLHRNSRPVDNIFMPDEILYRYFAAPGDKQDWKTQDGISATLFPVTTDSCNRSKYCLASTDVLYNDLTGEYRHDMGILAIPVNVFLLPYSFLDKKIYRTFTLIPNHAPNECNYAHSQIEVYESGIKMPKPPPRTIKALIRDNYMKMIENKTISIVKYPT